MYGLIEIAERALAEVDYLNFDQAWREAHNRQCEFQISAGDADGGLCGSTNVTPSDRVPYCMNHQQYADQWEE